MWQEALNSAMVAWSSAIDSVGWVDIGFCLCYLLCSWLCYVSGYAARENAEPWRDWMWGCGLLVMLGLDSIVQAELPALEFIRSIARAQGAYTNRRETQFLVLCAVLLVCILIFAWMRTRLTDTWALRGPAMLGMCVLVLLALTRFVSFHYTDAILNAHVIGIPVERLAELTGLGLVFVGTTRWLRTR